MTWFLVLVLYTHSHNAVYGPKVIASLPTKEICERVQKDAQKNFTSDAEFYCVNPLGGR